MIRTLLLGLSGVITLMLTSLAQAEHPQHCSCGEPRIKFLDDLLHPFSMPATREPFEERIETERHDFTQSTKTIARGVTQIEAGYTFYYNDEAAEIEKSHTGPEMLIRFGLSDDIEFRVRWNYVWKFIDEDDDQSFSEDLRWSFKLAVTDQECWIPESALEVRFTAPTGSPGFSTRQVEFGLDYIYGWKLSEICTLYGSSGFLTQGLGDLSLFPEEAADDRFVNWTQSVALGVELTERTTFYAEWFGIISHGLEDDYSLRFFNVGVDYYVSDDFVLDIRFGVGLSGEEEDFFSGVGGGYRF